MPIPHQASKWTTGKSWPMFWRQRLMMLRTRLENAPTNFMFSVEAVTDMLNRIGSMRNWNFGPLIRSENVWLFYLKLDGVRVNRASSNLFKQLFAGRI